MSKKLKFFAILALILGESCVMNPGDITPGDTDPKPGDTTPGDTDQVKFTARLRLGSPNGHIVDESSWTSSLDENGRRLIVFDGYIVFTDVGPSGEYAARVNRLQLKGASGAWGSNPDNVVEDFHTYRVPSNLSQIDTTSEMRFVLTGQWRESDVLATEQVLPDGTFLIPANSVEVGSVVRFRAVVQAMTNFVEVREFIVDIREHSFSRAPLPDDRNFTTEQVLTSGSFSIPAGSVEVGSVVRFRAAVFSGSLRGSNDTFTARLRLGGSTGHILDASSWTSSVNETILNVVRLTVFEGHIVFTDVGPSGKYEVRVNRLQLKWASGAWGSSSDNIIEDLKTYHDTDSTPAIDTTSEMELAITGEWSQADINNRAAVRAFSIDMSEARFSRAPSSDRDFTTEQVLTGGSSSIPANSVEVGSVVRFRAVVEASSVAGSGDRFSARLRLGGLPGHILDTSTWREAGDGDRLIVFEGHIVFTGVGPAGEYEAGVDRLQLRRTGVAWGSRSEDILEDIKSYQDTVSTPTIDTTSDMELAITGEWDQAADFNVAKVLAFSVGVN